MKPSNQSKAQDYARPDPEVGRTHPTAAKTSLEHRSSPPFPLLRTRRTPTPAAAAALAAIQLGLACALLAVFARANDPAEPRFTVDHLLLETQLSPVSGGAFSVTGQIQPADDAGSTLSGGTFSLETGSFSLVPDNPSEPPAPRLLAIFLGGTVELRWATQGAEGFVLEESFDLGPNAQWSEVGTPSSLVDGEHRLLVQASQARRFFRLHRR